MENKTENTYLYLANWIEGTSQLQKIWEQQLRNFPNDLSEHSQDEGIKDEPSFPLIDIKKDTTRLTISQIRHLVIREIYSTRAESIIQAEVTRQIDRFGFEGRAVNNAETKQEVSHENEMKLFEDPV